MDEGKFLDEMVEILDTDKALTMDTRLDALEEWDSIAYVSFIAAMSDATERKLPPREVRKAETIGDLYRLAFQ